MISLNKSLLLLLFLLCFGCEEPVELDLGLDESRLVVTANFHPQEPFRVWVSESYSPLSDEYPKYLKDAEVKIYKGNEILENLVLTRDTEYPFTSYRSTNLFRPLPGVEYAIQVTAPNHEPVRSKDVIPSATTLNGSMISNLAKEYPGDNLTDLFFSFDLTIELGTPQTTPAYYHLDTKYEIISYYLQGLDTMKTNTGEYVSLDLELLENDISIQQHYDKGVLFKTEDAGPLTLRFRATTPNVIYLSQELFEQIQVDLHTVSRDYYLYQTSISRQYSQTGSILNDPGLVYNNIENGYGIFAGYNTVQRSISVNVK